MDRQQRQDKQPDPPANATITSQFLPNLLNGVTVLKAEVPAVVIKNNSIETVRQTLTAIPYYSWANRGKGEMTVWFPIAGNRYPIADPIIKRRL
jgi:hypothetical protein